MFLTLMIKRSNSYKRQLGEMKKGVKVWCISVIKTYRPQNVSIKKLLESLACWPYRTTYDERTGTKITSVPTPTVAWKALRYSTPRSCWKIMNICISVPSFFNLMRHLKLPVRLVYLFTSLMMSLLLVDSLRNNVLFSEAKNLLALKNASTVKWLCATGLSHIGEVILTVNRYVKLAQVHVWVGFFCLGAWKLLSSGHKKEQSWQITNYATITGPSQTSPFIGDWKAVFQQSNDILALFNCSDVFW